MATLSFTRDGNTAHDPAWRRLMHDAQYEGTLQIFLLGEFRVLVDGAPCQPDGWARKKSRALVQILALQARHSMHREQVLDGLWPHLDPAAATNQLYKTLHHARRALEPDLAPRAESRFLRVEGDVVRLAALHEVWVDADAFEIRANAALTTGNVDALDEALALYGGDLLPDSLYEEWTEDRRERLALLYQRVLFRSAEIHAARERGSGRAIELLDRLVAIDSLHEDAHRLLIHLYGQRGEFGRAARQYEICRETLDRELGVRPDPETTAVFDAMRDDPSTALAVASPPTTAPVIVVEPKILGRSPERRRFRTRWAVAAALLGVLCAIVFLPGTPWSARMRYKLGRVLDKGISSVWADGTEDRQLISLRGRIDGYHIRVEAIDSVSGWATLSDNDGAFRVLDVQWTPGRTYKLLVSNGQGAPRTILVPAPEQYPPDGVLDVGTLELESGRPATAVDLCGANSRSLLLFDAANAGYYRGVFDAITAGMATDQERIEALTLFVAARLTSEVASRTMQVPRATIETGTSSPGDLSVAMATIVFASGYDVRLIDVVDDSRSRRSHLVVEVRYGNEWHLFDPAFGIVPKDPDGRVPSYEDLLSNPTLVPVQAYAGCQRKGWDATRAPKLLTTGIHHLYTFTLPPSAGTSEDLTQHSPDRWDVNRLPGAGA